MRGPKWTATEQQSLVAEFTCDPKVSNGGYEGIEQRRHNQTGVVVFTDGHSESRKDKNINPPIDPYSGSATALFNSKYWDPMKHAGDR
jgi:prepilin-type processing-associated H-X9-DG protein